MLVVEFKLISRAIPILRMFVLQSLVVVRDWIEQIVPRTLKGVQCAVNQVEGTV